MGKRVLVVDDEKLIVKGIRFSLLQDGLEVDCAYDGEEALQMAKEVVLGAAKLLESGAGNPMELADMVCSPGGTTIEGVHKLREHGFEYAVYEAVGAVADKDRLLGKK